jgi:hypothetical protein
MPPKRQVENLLAFDRLAAVWLDHYENEKERRPASVAMARLVVNRYLLPVLASKPMPHITRADMQPILDSIPTAKRGCAGLSLLMPQSFSAGHTSAATLPTTR